MSTCCSQDFCFAEIFPQILTLGTPRTFSRVQFSPKDCKDASRFSRCRGVPGHHPLLSPPALISSWSPDWLRLFFPLFGVLDNIPWSVKGVGQEHTKDPSHGSLRQEELPLKPPLLSALPGPQGRSVQAPAVNPGSLKMDQCLLIISSLELLQEFLMREGF